MLPSLTPTVPLARCDGTLLTWKCSISLPEASAPPPAVFLHQFSSFNSFNQFQDFNQFHLMCVCFSTVGHFESESAAFTGFSLLFLFLCELLRYLNIFVAKMKNKNLVNLSCADFRLEKKKLHQVPVQFLRLNQQNPKAEPIRTPL